MKFYNITYHSFRQSLYLLSFACFAVGSQAQNASNSPYSRFGIGDLQTIQTPRHLGMGGLSVGLAGVSDFSSKNPASYLNLDSLQVAFEVSLQGTYSRLHEQQPNSEMTSANTNSVSLGQISFAFPITPWLKSSFGLTPKSNMNYNVIREISGDPNLGRQILNHSGQGGLSQVFLGIAGGTSSIAVGVNANYQFGSFVRSAGLLFVDTVLQAPRGTYQDKEVEAAGFAFDLGLQYKQPLLRNYQLGVGFTYSPKYNLNGSRSLLAYAGYGDQGRTLRDTISATGAVEGTLRMPDKYTIGLSFERLNRWVFGAEYAVVNFKNYQEFFQGDTNLSNAYTFRTGLELKGRR
ncbi:MAG: outer membrane protein transport protein, partial [Bacteroidales bacterium]|nr:outer membrane protein transport protein [Bacteroidales bacterium]